VVVSARTIFYFDSNEPSSLRINFFVTDAFELVAPLTRPSLGCDRFAHGRPCEGGTTSLLVLWSLQRSKYLPSSPPSGTLAATLSSHRGDDQGIGIGIDLGTTNSAVAVLSEDGVPCIIPISGNGRTIPSVVALVRHEDNSLMALVGREACQHESRTRIPSYRHTKRVLGTGGRVPAEVASVVPHVCLATEGRTLASSSKRRSKSMDSLTNRLHDAKYHPTLLHEIVTDQSGKLVDMGNDGDEAGTSTRRTIAPEFVSAEIVRALKQAAEEFSGRVVTRAVIGVPAYFHDQQRQATISAAIQAGISKVKLIREPEAAALAYEVEKGQIPRSKTSRTADKLGGKTSDELVLVFDLGGGTYDVSMLLVGGGVTEVISTSGNAQLGGSDFDRRIVQHWLDDILRVSGSVGKTGDRPGQSSQSWSLNARASLQRAAETVRIYLSNTRQARLALPRDEFRWENLGDEGIVLSFPESEHSHVELTPLPQVLNETHVGYVLTRAHLERLCSNELHLLLRPIREVAIMAGALLPGDTSPTLVEAALQAETDLEVMPFQEFYAESPENEVRNDEATRFITEEMHTKAAKKAQQQGRKKARDTSKDEKKFRLEKRRLADAARVPAAKLESGTGAVDVKIRDGITGQPISRVVLVGGATRMPAVGRLIAALTGVTPQRTLNPDEAVALGCAVQVGILDGSESVGTVLNPMQAAILRAVAEQNGLLRDNASFEDGFDETNLETISTY
jgi:molecular chaperone DnaK (HSP70)